MKTVSILGSCVSRHLFNYGELKNNYQVNFYAFQSNMWDLFSHGVNLNMDIINSIPTENFHRRMFDLDANKKIISELEKANSDYLVIDLYTLAVNCLKLTYHNQTVYVNNNAQYNIDRYFKENKHLNIKSEIINFEDIPEKLILEGLDKLASYIKENCKLKNVIVLKPAYAKKFFSVNNNIINFGECDLKTIQKREKIIDKYTKYICKQLKGCKKPNIQNTKEYCVFIFEDLIINTPNPVHYPKYEEKRMARQLFEFLENKKLEIDEYEDLCREYDILNNTLYKTINIVRRTKSEVITSLNKYFYDIVDLKKNIVIVSVKHEASTKLHKFIAKNKLELNMNIGKADSYIGIIDKASKFKYEETSQNQITYNFKKKRKKFEIVSAGANCGNVSSIKINGVEYSKNRRGLNFVVVNNKTLEVVQSFYCDTYDDDNALISLEIKN